MKNKILKLVRILTLTCLMGLMFSFSAFAAKTTAVTRTDISEEEEWENSGPGVADTEEEETEDKKEYKPGDSLGIFVTSGYCNCSKCSAGHNLTYAGTVPQAGHTISANLSVLPIGTKVIINDILYTVEDTGSGLTSNHIDIYYADHDTAWDHGIQNAEVFLAE